MEFGSFVHLALHGNGSAHGVHDILCDGHPQPRALGLMNPHAVRPCIGIEDMLHKALLHPYSVVLHCDMRPDIGIPFLLGGRLLKQGQLYGSSLMGVLDCIGQQIQQNLIQTDTVAAYILCHDIINMYIEILPFSPDLRLNNADDPLYHFAQ